MKNGTKDGKDPTSALARVDHVLFTCPEGGFSIFFFFFTFYNLEHNLKKRCQGPKWVYGTEERWVCVLQSGQRGLRGHEPQDEEVEELRGWGQWPPKPC